MFVAFLATRKMFQIIPNIFDIYLILKTIGETILNFCSTKNFLMRLVLVRLKRTWLIIY